MIAAIDAGWDWMKSADGQAAATWGSAVLSLFAIGIALFVFGIEQKRANAERLAAIERNRLEEQRAQTATVDRKANFLRLCIDTIDEALLLLEQEMHHITVSSRDYVDWDEDVGVPHVIIPVRDVLKSLQAVWQDDMATVLALGRTVRTLTELTSNGPGLAPRREIALGYCKPRVRDLISRQNRFLEILGRLTGEVQPQRHSLENS